MGDHEKKTSNKRFRPGTPIKYFHEKFRKNSTTEDLASILRTTTLSSVADRQRKVHNKQHMRLQRYKQLEKQNNKISSDDDSTTVPKYQHLEEVSLDEFEFNLNSEAGSVDLDGDHLQAIENVSPNSPQHLLDDNALSVALLVSNNEQLADTNFDLVLNEIEFEERKSYEQEARLASMNREQQTLEAEIERREDELHIEKNSRMMNK
jgi:hypothetical protein